MCFVHSYVPSSSVDAFDSWLIASIRRIICQHITFSFTVMLNEYDNELKS